jgi:hypothetical protein
MHRELVSEAFQRTKAPGRRVGLQKWEWVKTIQNLLLAYLGKKHPLTESLTSYLLQAELASHS